MNIALDNADRAMAEDFRERRELDPLSGHACSEGVAEVVENQIQLDAGRLCLLAETIMRVFTLETCRPGLRLEGKSQGLRDGDRVVDLFQLARD